MKPFIKKFLIFLIPLIICLIYIETYLQFYPSAFNIKAKYLKSNEKEITTLVLGSSHNQEALNPQFFTHEIAANMAFGGQDPQLDSRILNKYIDQLPKLKYVILELAYHTLESKDSYGNERNNLYLRFHGINNFGRRVYPDDYSIFLPYPKLYVEFLNPFLEKTPVNKFGFVTKLSKFEKSIQRFNNLNFNAELINADRENLFITRHRYEDLAAYEINKLIFEDMVSVCVKHRVTPVILITPVYATYYETMIPAKKQRRDDFMNYLVNKYPSALVLNYENSGEFAITDFTNDDHLIPEGAKKFTIKVDSILSSKNEPSGEPH